MPPDAKSCCSFYENDLVRQLFGESLHPGGLALTKQLAERIGLDESDNVLEIASGYGTSGIFLAKSFGCNITAIDISRKLVQKAAEDASRNGMEGVSSCLADAQNLPFRDGAFSAIISECSICTFSNKSRALSEAFRVLRSGGCIGISDPIVRGRIDGPLGATIGQALCLAGALEPSEYVDRLTKIGYDNIRIEDRADAIVGMLEGIRKRLFLAELLVGIGRLQVENEMLIRAKELLTEVRKCVDDRKVGYIMVTAERH